MDKQNAKILMLVEGQKTDVKIMEHLLSVYGIRDHHQIVSYKTNIYVLYKKMFAADDPDSLDLLQVLKENEKDASKKHIFDERYSDILLIFDLDPQDTEFSSEKIHRMLEYFNESTENGMLYINYPMVESYYHMKSLPDPEYQIRTVSLDDLERKEYKTRVRDECLCNFRDFAQSKEECNIVIRQNLEKALRITGKMADENLFLPLSLDILSVQDSKMKEDRILYVLCTCVFYIVDFNPKLIVSDFGNQSDTDITKME